MSGSEIKFTSKVVREKIKGLVKIYLKNNMLKTLLKQQT